jgi:hypothetical protein
MDTGKIRSALTAYDMGRVGIYINYLEFAAIDKKSDKSLKNPWLQYAKDEDLVQVFKKVQIDGLWVNGTSVTLGFRGSILPVYNFQAYKDKLIIAYPESKVDLQLVHEGDEFSLNKESGKVNYSHDFGDPFAVTRVIIGAYCIVKNKRGEFIETLNMVEISKMKEAAKTKAIWNVWEGEMILKSVIKRACKRHFNDHFEKIMKVDNEENDLDLVGIDSNLQEAIRLAKTADDLKVLFKDHVQGKKNESEPKILELLATRREELKKDLK